MTELTKRDYDRLVNAFFWIGVVLGAVLTSGIWLAALGLIDAHEKIQRCEESRR